MKLILDFDDTIFDTERFKKEKLFLCLEKQGVSASNFEQNYKKYGATHPTYDLSTHLKSLCREFNIQIDTDSVIYEISKGLEEFVFPEYLEIIKKYGRENIFILTQGDLNFQQLKIKRSEVDKKVEQILIVRDSKKEKLDELALLWPNETIVFVDDKFKNLYFETSNHAIARIFVGNVSTLTEEQKTYLEKNNITLSSRENIKTDIESSRELIGIETSPEYIFERSRVI